MRLSRKLTSLIWTTVVVAILALTWVGLARTYPEIDSARYLPDRVFRLLKTLMGNDPLGGGLEARDLAWQLIAAKVLVCVLLVRALVKLVSSVFSEHVQNLRVWLKPNPTLVVGAGRKAQVLANDLKSARGETVVVVERAESSATKSLQDDGHVVVTGDVTRSDTLRSAGALKARRVICFAQDQQLGIQVAGRVRQLWAARAETGEGCDCYVHLDNPRLVDLLGGRSDRDHAVRVHFFNLHKMVARGLFEGMTPALPAVLNEADRLEIDLVGWGPEARAILLQGLRVLHLGLPRGVAWRVWTDKPTESQTQWAASYPMASSVTEVEFDAPGGHCRCVVERWLASDPGTARLVICASGDDEVDLTAAAELLYANESAAFPIYVRCADGRGLPALLTSQRARLQLFGDEQSFCTVEMVCGERQDKLAQAIHADYLRQIQGTASESAAYKSAWDALSEEARDANRAQADHLPYKQMLADLWSAHGAQDVNERLARVEHDRWAAHRYLQGWSFGEVRDDARKQHPSLVPWAALSEGEREKDRDAVRRVPDLLAAGA